ncbi:type II toxin-antitoxin system Phd/YefM family antitoxin [Jeotgalicoccus meleagridis]|uniref:Antitoxin n=1 Tax=Jeotgalicoccus meleagridis TaxID=2759181 RepID=A0A6V7RJQ0_9STAP|nr:type II toxin-antitoxin system Phd/YefM family antitoxin [Jeotgalicoccus meleagridis]CAD2077456.1 hypothetical protein JEODO184_01158 [Jeotgalicoccus meleagridis]
MNSSRSINIDIKDLKQDPNKVFETAEKEKRVIHVLDENESAGVLMSKAQYEFALDEIESLYDVIDELTVSDNIANSDEKTFSVDHDAFERIKDMQLYEDWD